MDLITGGAGFIGIHLARRLIEMGEGVRAIDIVRPDLPIDNNRIQYSPKIAMKEGMRRFIEW